MKSTSIPMCLVVGSRDDIGKPAARAIKEAGYEPSFSVGEREAIEALRGAARVTAVVVSPASLSRTEIASLAAAAGQREPPVPVLVLGRGPSLQDAVDAIQLGAAAYEPSPVAPARLLEKLRQLRKAEPVDRASPRSGFMGIVGTSPAIEGVFTTIERISRFKTNVLLLGESGTGKELIARAIHARGPRKHHMFVPINCATLGREILENELFGHEKGAFTGADDRKLGLFEQADGGTLFLDEIAEMDRSTQAKLLRALERHEFRRVGGTTKVKVDLSVVAATNRDLEREVEAGRFREDLYYRLKVVTISIPPLRERRADIPALVRAFIADFNARHGTHVRGLLPEALARLQAHDWPGNVRELRNSLESALMLAPGEWITADDLGRFGHMSPSAPTQAPARAAAVAGAQVVIPIGTTCAQAEQLLILATVAASPTKQAAARTLGIGVTTLYEKLRAYHSESEGETAESDVRHTESERR
ncbi:MAG: sigma-54-dependent Fis family transcriptional regulator [Deltaproteobacteria bacterium]|nr:sigma-54-dependent Fis family transcriptional regulator [Deltaproteobacteria bacterium]